MSLAKLKSLSDNLDGRDQWLEYAIQAKVAFYKFASGRPVSAQDIEDIYQNVVTHLVMNVDIDPTFGRTAVKKYVLRRLTGALQDFCRSKDTVNRKNRKIIRYIDEKVRNGKSLEQVLEEEKMTLSEWNLINKSQAVDFELGSRGDIFAAVTSDNGDKSSPIADYSASTILFDDSDEDDEEVEKDICLAEKIKGAVSAFFDTLDPIDKIILYSYFFARKNMRAIALFTSVTESRICQKINEALVDKKDMKTTLESLRSFKEEDSLIYDAVVDLRESLLMEISLDLDDEQNADLNGFISEEKVKIGRQDLLEVLESVSSAFKKMSL